MTQTNDVKDFGTLLQQTWAIECGQKFIDLANLVYLAERANEINKLRDVNEINTQLILEREQSKYYRYLCSQRGIEIEDLKYKIKQLIRITKEEVTCKSCHGSGKVPEDIVPREVECFGCKGTGMPPKLFTALQAIEKTIGKGI